MNDDTFHEALGLTRVDEHTFTTDLHAAYHLWHGTFIHGGFSMAVGAQAMALASGRPGAATLTAHFLEQVDLVPTTIHTEVLREGGRHSTVRARLVQDGRDRVVFTGVIGDVAAAKGPTRHRPAPSVPAWEGCVDTGFPSSFKQHVDGRLDPATAGFLKGVPSGSDFVQGRLRFHSDEVIDAPALAFLADVLISPSIEVGEAAMGWIPTVELTVHVHDPTWRGEVLARIWTDHVTGGYATEDVELWSGDGERLLAVGRQLALVRAPA